MWIKINGEVDQIPENATIWDLVVTKTLQDEMILVFVNGEMVSREDWNRFRLSVGDSLEIIKALPGG